MNYRQQLILEALQELETEDPSLLVGVTDVSADWEDKSRNVVYFLVLNGAMYPIRIYGNTKYHPTLRIWGVQKAIKDKPEVRREEIEDIKEHLISTIHYVRKRQQSAFGCRYPGLTT